MIRLNIAFWDDIALVLLRYTDWFAFIWFEHLFSPLIRFMGCQRWAPSFNQHVFPSPFLIQRLWVYEVIKRKKKKKKQDRRSVFSYERGYWCFLLAGTHLGHVFGRFARNETTVSCVFSINISGVKDEIYWELWGVGRIHGMVLDGAKFGHFEWNLYFVPFGDGHIYLSTCLFSFLLHAAGSGRRRDGIRVWERCLGVDWVIVCLVYILCGLCILQASGVKREINWLGLGLVCDMIKELSVGFLGTDGPRAWFLCKRNGNYCGCGYLFLLLLLGLALSGCDDADFQVARWEYTNCSNKRCLGYWYWSWYWYYVSLVLMLTLDFLWWCCIGIPVVSLEIAVNLPFHALHFPWFQRFFRVQLLTHSPPLAQHHLVGGHLHHKSGQLPE